MKNKNLQSSLHTCENKYFHSAAAELIDVFWQDTTNDTENQVRFFTSSIYSK